ncbi:MAG: response regulator [bacterium]|nr:response regulator [bacterium]
MQIGGEPKSRSKEGNEGLDLRILIADDNNLAIKLLTIYLKQKYPLATIESVKNGKELVSRLSDPSQNFNFIFTDQNMPEMTGLEAAMEIRSKGNNIPIIMITAQSADSFESLKAEAEKYKVYCFQKPLTKEVVSELYAAMEGMITMQ